MNLLKSKASWQHHRSGWSYCLQSLLPLHRDDGVIFVSCIEDYLVSWNRLLDVPWVGFTHNPPTHSSIAYRMYPGTPDLTQMLNSDNWKHNSKYCLGIFCLSKYAYNYIRPKTQLPLNMIYHPTEFPSVKFDWSNFCQNQNKQLILVGHWLRKFQDIYDIQSPFTKSILKATHKHLTDENYKEIYDFVLKEDRQEVHFLPRLSNYEFDILMSKNIIFVPLHDSIANNTIIECIARNTPVLVNKLPSVIEYLGEDYPLFYSNIEEAQQKLMDIDLLKYTHEYLLSKDKSFLTSGYFLQSVKESEVYKRTFKYRNIKLL